jgi:hypothetical protein
MLADSQFDENLKKQAEEEADRIEEEKFEEGMAWADQMEEALEKEKKLKQAQQQTQQQAPNDPTLDPNNAAWMQDVIDQEKKKHGEDFGEDISFSMEED